MISFLFPPGRPGPSFKLNITLSLSTLVPFGLCYSLLYVPSTLSLTTLAHMTVYMPTIADPDIAKVTRLASLLPIVIHSLLSLTPPVETYT